LKGCAHNKNILDIFLITDIKVNMVIPENVIVKNLSWDELQRLFSQKLEFPINMKKSYKLCDFKPMYGLIFEDIIEKYDFWGYCDVDIIFGDLKKYFTPNILDKFDVLTFREFIISGAFTILKNNEYTKTLFKKSPNLEYVISSEEYVSFDESGNKRVMCRKRIPAYDLLYIDNLVCWTSIIQKEDDNGNLKLYARDYLKESLPFNSCLIYSNGEIKLTPSDEFIGYHMVTEKRNPEFIIPSWKKVDDTFYITPTGFYNKKSNFNFLITRYRKIRGKYFRLKKRISDSINYRFKFIK